MSLLFQTNLLKIEVEPSEIPWLKLFTKEPYKEMSEVPKVLRDEIYVLLDFIEKEMIAYFEPSKINIASFGNYMPHVHWHIMARFQEDSYFPEPMWGKKQRDAALNLPSFDLFHTQLVQKLNQRDFLTKI
jgi:diadenosine tetraphosphate (Ap4A) HIT family hydrolase